MPGTRPFGNRRNGVISVLLGCCFIGALVFLAIYPDRNNMEKNTMVEPESTVAANSADIARLIGQLGNDDVHWDGTTFGLVPSVESEAAQKLLAAGDAAIPPLINVLDDESRFVTAHVLLTLLSGVEHLTNPWNGLNIELLSTGQVRFDVNQRFELKRRWQTWLKTSPRPRSLPDQEYSGLE